MTRSTGAMAEADAAAAISPAIKAVRLTNRDTGAESRGEREESRVAITLTFS
jgi:hypothetical protein